ncbi:hypothetical protein CYMTET_23527 [Cymbomonas tetramitiformis]|uniref:Serine hydrolase domain-containing protein n=1 Tax=Cymbomonas tetramitiformis TaxID=36881 RepID=A0AAE0FYG6_9CHLO|nr:hypothetical protein CYMTET_23527 [Cymbomonas tetramitiformis]
MSLSTFIRSRGEKIRLLALHGGGTNSKIFDFQLRSIVNSLDRDIELIFLDGPVVDDGTMYVDPTVRRAFPDSEFRFWFRVEVDKIARKPTRYFPEDIRTGVSYILDYLKSVPPVDGLIGFSQGANAALMFLALVEMHRLPIPPGFLAPRFVVLFSPTYFGWADAATQAFPSTKCPSPLFTKPLSTPALIIIGEADHTREYSENATTLCSSRQIAYHPKGHQVPKDNGVCEALQVFLDEHSATKG